jgi:hypothetical protein
MFYVLCEIFFCSASQWCLTQFTNPCLFLLASEILHSPYSVSLAITSPLTFVLKFLGLSHKYSVSVLSDKYAYIKLIKQINVFYTPMLLLPRLRNKLLLHTGEAPPVLPLWNIFLFSLSQDNHSPKFDNFLFIFLGSLMFFFSC